MNIKYLNKREIPANFYICPWGMYIKTPIATMDAFSSFTTYYNIKNTLKKLASLIKSVKFQSFERYISRVGL